MAFASPVLGFRPSLYDLLQFDNKVTGSGRALLKIGIQLKAKSLTAKLSQPHVNDIW